jgi:hypothetical protein
MKEFLLIFRMDILTPEVQPTVEQMEVYMKDWMEWVNDIYEHGELAEGGNHLSNSGTVLRSNNRMTCEPYTVNNESVSGYILILAKDRNDAVRIAKKCPILQGEGTSVEIRETATPEDMK